MFRKSFTIVMIMIINSLTSHDDLGLCGTSLVSPSPRKSVRKLSMTLQTLSQVSEQLIDQTASSDC